MTNCEENKDEGYGIDANGSNSRERKMTQPLLEFPVREHGFSNELLKGEGDDDENCSSSDKELRKSGDDIDNWLSKS